MIDKRRLRELKMRRPMTAQEQMAFDTFSAGLEIGKEQQRLLTSNDREDRLRLAEQGAPTNYDLWLKEGCPGV